MAKGETFPSESRTFQDPDTGAQIRQLTDHRAHSHHLYFTNPGWYDGGRRLLFGSDRRNGVNLYSVELPTGELTQMTDLPDAGEQKSNLFHSVSLNPVCREAYFWHDSTLRAIDLDTLEERPLYTVPEGFTAGGETDVTADGAHVVVRCGEDLTGRFRMDLGNGYVGFQEYWQATPLSRIVRISVEDADAEVVHEEQAWVGHVNASPKHPHLLTFCHEGPWDKVDQRIWLLDLSDGTVSKLRPTPDEAHVGHEYWLADGEHIGYHGWWSADRSDPFHGTMHYTGTDQVEAAVDRRCMHFHSWGRDLVVGDGTGRSPQLTLWRRRGGKLEGPRLLHRHRGSFHTQAVHVHPTFSPDGAGILFTADPQGYGNVYLADIPAFESLPAA